MKILLIKTGYTETFDFSGTPSSVVSLGDVLRTTVVLHLFLNDDVTWLTSEEARPLLEHNPHIRILETNPRRLHESYDLIVNFEQSPVPEGLKGKLFLGFSGSDQLLTSEGVFHAREWITLKELSAANWSQKFFNLFGKSWDGESYLLFPREERGPLFDVGLNWKVGVKWPSKSWPLERWSELHARLLPFHSVSWQEGFDSIPAYVSWIQSCETLVTHDSLGLHIGLALGKRITALFGPTSSGQIPLEKTRVLSLAEAPSFGCPPCHQELCRSNIHCVGTISVDAVAEAVRNNLKDRDVAITTGREQALTSS